MCIRDRIQRPAGRGTRVRSGSAVHLDAGVDRPRSTRLRYDSLIEIRITAEQDRNAHQPPIACHGLSSLRMPQPPMTSVVVPPPAPTTSVVVPLDRGPECTLDAASTSDS